MTIYTSSTVSMRLFGTALISAFLLLSTSVVAAATPTPEQLVALVQAARARYQSVDVQFAVKRFESAGEAQEQRLAGSAIHIRRTTDNRIYSSTARTEFDAAGTVVFAGTTSFAFAPSWAKKLEEVDGSAPRAVVERSKRMISQLELYPGTAMWAPYGENVWRKATNSNSTVLRDGKTGIVTLVFAPKRASSRSVIAIDPAHGYLPVKTELQHPDGRACMSVELSDLRQVEGELWFPFAYTADTYTTKPMHYTSVFTVASAHLNTEIPDDMLDVRFPTGTIVEDKIAGLHYVVDDVDASMSEVGAPEVALVTPEDTWATRPASDADLDAVGKKMALREQSVYGTSSYLNTIVFAGFGAVALVVLLGLSRRRRSHVKS